MGKNKRLPVWHTDFLADELVKLGWDPVAEYCRTLSQLQQCIEECKDVAERAEIIARRADLIERIWKYCFPTKRSVEITGQVTQALVSLTPAELSKITSADAFKNAVEVIAAPEDNGTTKDPFSQ